MLAAVFVKSGFDQLRHPAMTADAARPLATQLASRFSIPDDPETVVRANGAAMAGAGALLAIGKAPRLSSAVLAATLVPQTYTTHRFWEAKDPEEKRQQQNHFLKNVALLGGVLLASVDTEGRPGIAWRARHATRDAGRTAKRAKKEARLAAKAAKQDAKHAARRAGDAVHVG